MTDRPQNGKFWEIGISEDFREIVINVPIEMPPHWYHFSFTGDEADNLADTIKKKVRELRKLQLPVIESFGMWKDTD